MENKELYNIFCNEVDDIIDYSKKHFNLPKTINISISWNENIGFNNTNNLPNSDVLFNMLIRLRKFLLDKNNLFINKIHNRLGTEFKDTILEKEIKNISNFRKEIKKIKSQIWISIDWKNYDNISDIVWYIYNWKLMHDNLNDLSEYKKIFNNPLIWQFINSQLIDFILNNLLILQKTNFFIKTNVFNKWSI